VQRAIKASSSSASKKKVEIKRDTKRNKETEQEKVEIGDIFKVSIKDSIWVPAQIVDKRLLRKYQKELIANEIKPSAIGPDHHEYFVHYLNYDRRMDEWVGIERVDTRFELTKLLKTASELDEGAVSLDNVGTLESVIHVKNVDVAPKAPIILVEDDHAEHGIHYYNGGNGDKNVAKKYEVRNIRSIHLGCNVITTWYNSCYPVEINSHGRLFLCPHCLDYKNNMKSLIEHRCSLRNPPGKIMYKDPVRKIAMWEVDGRKDNLFCHHLCLLSMLFLHTKSVYKNGDVESFMFYVLCEYDEYNGAQVVGYFSKEKNSPQKYNVACILTLPPYQRKGYGKVLIAISYELSKLEGNYQASPEKPLSDLGEIAYRKYWTIMVLKHLLVTSANRSDILIDGNAIEAYGQSSSSSSSSNQTNREKVAEMRGTLYKTNNPTIPVISSKVAKSKRKSTRSGPQHQHLTDLEAEISDTSLIELPMGINIGDIARRTGICHEDICSTLNNLTEISTSYDSKVRILTPSNGLGNPTKPAKVVQFCIKPSIIQKFLSNKEEYWPTFCERKYLSWSPSQHSQRWNGTHNTVSSDKRSPRSSPREMGTDSFNGSEIASGDEY
jgi:hypothetical protein